MENHRKRMENGWLNAYVSEDAGAGHQKADDVLV